MHAFLMDRFYNFRSFEDTLHVFGGYTPSRSISGSSLSRDLLGMLLEYHAHQEPRFGIVRPSGSNNHSTSFNASNQPRRNLDVLEFRLMCRLMNEEWSNECFDFGLQLESGVKRQSCYEPLRVSTTFGISAATNSSHTVKTTLEENSYLDVRDLFILHIQRSFKKIEIWVVEICSSC